MKFIGVTVATLIASLVCLSFCACNATEPAWTLSSPEGEPSLILAGVPPQIVKAYPDGSLRFATGHTCREALDGFNLNARVGQMHPALNHGYTLALSQGKTCEEIVRAMNAAFLEAKDKEAKAAEAKKDEEMTKAVIKETEK